MHDMKFAAREKVVPDHDVIDEAIREEAEGYTVFSIPVGVVYRPNEAKVRNLQSKDYLGKARLVAAQDQLSTDPRSRAARAAFAVDDRPSDKLSYAALNLVKPDLKSRSRQQSEPPMQRNIFPPTPPPEMDPPDSANSRTRRRSVEAGSSSPIRSQQQQSRPAMKPLRLDLGAAAFDQKMEPDRSQRRPKRSESERPAVRRQDSGATERASDFRLRDEITGRPVVPEVRIVEDPIIAYSQDVTQPQKPTHQRTKSSAQSTKSQPTISEEEEDDVSDPSDSAPLAFEIVPPRPTHRKHPSVSRRSLEIRKVRIKVHAEDMRYVMAKADVRFQELAEQIRQKFGLQGGFKLKVKDEDSDLITMGDDDDLEMAMGLCKAAAAKEKAEMGKMEIWIQEI